MLGRCYRTYYVGDGIFDVYGEISAENKNLLVLSSDAKKRRQVIIGNQPGNRCNPAYLLPYEREVTSPATHPEARNFFGVRHQRLVRAVFAFLENVWKN